MEAKRVIFALFVAATVVLSMSHQVSARLLLEERTVQQPTALEGANDELWEENGQLGSDKFAEFQNLDELDRLKMSISKLICGTMEEGCGDMDDSEDQSDTTGHSAESFSHLNRREFVQEY